MENKQEKCKKRKMYISFPSKEGHFKKKSICPICKATKKPKLH